MDDDNTSKSNLPPGRFKNIRQKFEMGSPPQDEENDYAVINDKESNNDVVVAPKPVPRQPPILKQKPSIKGQKPHFDEKGTPPIIVPRTKRDSFVKKEEHLNNSSEDLVTAKNQNSDIECSGNSVSSAGRTHRRGLSDCSTGKLLLEDDVKPEIFRNQRCSSTNIESDSSDGSGDAALVSKRLRVFQTPTPSKKPEIAPRPVSMIGFTSSLPRKKVSRNLSIKETNKAVSPSKDRPPRNASPTRLKLSQDDNIYKENDRDKENDNADNEDRVPKPPPKPPNLPVGAPPKKPPRTYKHDEFLKSKDSTVFKENELYVSSEVTLKKPMTKVEKDTPKRPPRPPPPRPPAPRSPLHGNQRENITSRRSLREPLYAYPNCKPKSPQNNSVISGVNGSPSKFALRKCLSVESIATESKGPPLPVYLETSKFGRSRDDLDALNGVEVFVDEEGYAVPYKFVVKGQMHSNKETTKQFDLREKIHDLKRRFGDPHAKTNSPRTSSHEPKLSRGKVNLVRQKINQSYAVMQRQPRKLPDAPYLDGTIPDVDSADGDSLVDESEIKKRLDYCSSVKSRTSERIKKSLRVLDKIYPQLFEYILSVGLRLNVELKIYEPYIIYKFPEIVDSNLSIPHFCFPDAEVYQPQEGMTSDTYWFVLTNFDGARVYGYCRRIWFVEDPFGPRLLPEVICIISPIEAINMYNSLLNEMEASRLKSPESMQELMASSFGRPLPSPGKAVQIRTMNYIGDVETINLNRPMDTRLEGVNLDCLLSTLGIEKLIWIFSTLLVERSVILCARNLSLLCSTVHALVALLYPFQWQHTYIPVLPSKMLEVVCSPTPYIVGVLSSYLPKIKNMQIEEVVILDLDRKHFVSNIGDESSILPKKIQKALKSALDTCRNEFDSDGSKNLMISEAFVRLFVELVGHVGNHVCAQQDGEKIFQREQFIRSVNSKSIRKFLEWFTETQMFDVFKHSLLEMSGSLELFLTRVFEHTSDNSGTGVKSNVKDFGKKMRNLGKALKTKFTPDSSL